MVTVALVCLSNKRRIPQQTIRTVQFTARNGFCNLTQAKLIYSHVQNKMQAILPTV